MPPAIPAECFTRDDVRFTAVNVFKSLREHAHPLHALRKKPVFRAISRHFDPIIPWRLSLLPRRIYLRLLSHASLILDSSTQEASVHETFLALLRELPSGGVFWDVGANVGCFSWYCASSRPDFEIVSFEPDAKNIKCLYRTSRAWNLPKHTIMPCAVAETTGRAVFLIDEVSGTTGTLEEFTETFNQFHYGASSQQIEIDTISLDDFLDKRRNPPSIIKIDVEGAELRVLLGASKLLDQHRPTLFFETFRHRAELITLLEKFGYHFYDSDRKQGVSDTTTNIIAIVPGRHRRALEILGRLGYPVESCNEPAYG